MSRRPLEAVARYLSDWRNLAAHAVVGAGLLALALLLPVHPACRIAGLAGVVGFNVVRMRRRALRSARTREARG